MEPFGFFYRKKKPSLFIHKHSAAAQHDIHGDTALLPPPLTANSKHLPLKASQSPKTGCQPCVHPSQASPPFPNTHKQPSCSCPFFGGCYRAAERPDPQQGAGNGLLPLPHPTAGWGDTKPAQSPRGGK